jgi:hypothetical protein
MQANENRPNQQIGRDHFQFGDTIPKPLGNVNMLMTPYRAPGRVFLRKATKSANSCVVNCVSSPCGMIETVP